MENIQTSPKMLIPQLIYGTAWKKEKTADLVVKAIKYGFRGIDTACQPKHYNEKGVGEALQRLRDEGIARESLFIQTKFTPINGQDPLTIPYDSTASLSDQVIQSFEVSQKNLNVVYLDGLILHSPLENIDITMTVWLAMEKIYNQKGTRHLGISNCYDLETLKELYNLAVIKPTIVQNRFYQETDFDSTIRKWCLEQKIIYQSFWTLTANPQILLNKVVQNAAQTYLKTPAQILFRALINMGIVPLTGTCSDTHMKEDLEILNFDLPSSVTQKISELFN